MSSLTLEKKVWAVLKSDPQSRNDDIRLTQVIWYKYHREALSLGSGGRYVVYLDKMAKLPREDTVKRIRAKIQNEQHMFLPTDKAVAIRRGMKEQEWREYLGYDTGDTL